MSMPGSGLGLVEGYFGAAWDWPARTTTMRFLAGHGYRFWRQQRTCCARYADIDHAAAGEIVGWLDGLYGVSTDIVQTQ